MSESMTEEQIDKMFTVLGSKKSDIEGAFIDITSLIKECEEVIKSADPKITSYFAYKLTKFTSEIQHIVKQQ